MTLVDWTGPLTLGPKVAIYIGEDALFVGYTQPFPDRYFIRKDPIHSFLDRYYRNEES